MSLFLSIERESYLGSLSFPDIKGWRKKQKSHNSYIVTLVM